MVYNGNYRHQRRRARRLSVRTQLNEYFNESVVN